MPQQHVIILGGKGFIGSAVAAEAVLRGWAVTVVDRDDYEAGRGMEADLLINANGNSKKYLSREDPALDFDLSVRSVAQSLRDFRFRHYVMLSTIDVYNDVTDPARNREDAVIDPTRLSPYGFHKRLAELLVQQAVPDALVLRMGGFVGLGLKKNPIYDLLTGAPLRVHPDSKYQFLHTGELARILFTLVEQERRGEIFNVTGDGLISPREIAAWIPDCTLPAPDPALVPEQYLVNNDSLKAILPAPSTHATVHTFVEQVLAGREPLS